MVKLIVIARVIPEEVYLRNIEQNVPITSILEKKFRVPVRDPDTWYIGRLAIEIKNCYERLYKRPLGEIKYLKDDEDDCDLDPQLSVSELLVDEGKAAKDGADQRVTVKIIQEQGRAIRAGSVIPDLSRAEYQPPARPPVPKFSDNKRPRGEQYDESEQVKRRRLGQIEEEEGDTLLNSIEQDGERAPSYFELPDARFLSALQAGAYDQILPKIESPELSMPWTNPQPATRDELEVLPEAPKDLQFRVPRTGLPVPGPRRSHGLEIRESSEVNFDQELGQISDQRRLNHAHPGHTRQTAHNQPYTPPNTGSTQHTPRGQAVSMLNGLKSASPADRRSLPRSANKFRKPGTNGHNIYDHPESDIDDSQMSPGSRNSRRHINPKSITPRLVSESQIQQNRNAGMDDVRRGSTANTSDQDNSISRQSETANPRLSYMTDGSSKRDVVMVDEESNQVDKSGSRPVSHKERRRSGSQQQPEPSPRQTTRSEKGAADGRDIHSTKRARSSKSRSSSTASSKRISRGSHAATSTSENQSIDQEDTTEELDGPGEQLLQSLNRSSVEPGKNSQSNTSVSAQKSNSRRRRKAVAATAPKSVEAEPLGRLPETDSEDAAEGADLKETQSAKGSKASKPGQSEELRCLTCWRKPSSCDNAQPKCASCTKSKKNCQIYKMTKEAATQELDQRKAANRKSSKVSPKSPSSSKANRKTIHTVSAQKASQQAKNASTTSSTDKVDAVENSVSEQDEAPASAKKRASKVRKRVVVEDEAKSVNRTSTGGKDATKKSSVQAKATPEPSVSTAGDAAAGKTKSTGNTKRLTDTKRPRSSGSNDTGSTGTDSKLNGTNQPRAQLQKEGSIESRTSSGKHIIPAGMTEEEYNSIISRRSQLTEEERKAENMRLRKLENRKASTPATVPPSVTSDTQPKTIKDVTKQVSQSSGSQTGSEGSNSDVQKLGSVKNTASVVQDSQKERSRKSLPSTQPAGGSLAIQTNTPAAKPVPQAVTEPPKSKNGAQKRTVPTPVPMAEKTSIVKNNPPFRPHKALANSLATVNQVPSTGNITIPPSISQAKSLSGLRNILDQKKSATSTPQPMSAIDRLVADTKRATDAMRFSFGGDDEDEETETESESEEDAEVQTKKSRPAVNAKTVKSPVLARQSGISNELESGSDVSDDD